MRPCNDEACPPLELTSARTSPADVVAGQAFLVVLLGAHLAEEDRVPTLPGGGNPHQFVAARWLL